MSPGPFSTPGDLLLQEPENKLGPLEVEWGTLNSSPSPQTPQPEGDLFHPMMLTCLTQVPCIAASSPPLPIPILQKQHLCRSHSWQKGCPYS